MRFMFDKARGTLTFAIALMMALVMVSVAPMVSSNALSGEGDSAGIGRAPQAQAQAWASQAPQAWASQAQAPQAPQASQASQAQLNHVTDAAGLLSEDERDALEDQAELIEDLYDFGVYIVTVDDYRSYSTGGVYQAGTAIYDYYTLGVGEGREGLMLLLSMNDRDYALVIHGEAAHYAFSDNARTLMTEYFLDDFAANSWYWGFVDYLDVAEQLLEAAAAGDPYVGSSSSSAPHYPSYSNSSYASSDDDLMTTLAIGVAAIFLIPLLIAFAVTRHKAAQMESVAPATEAHDYVIGGLQLTSSNDTFSHTTEVVTRIPQPDKMDGGPTHHHGGGKGGFGGIGGFGGGIGGIGGGFGGGGFSGSSGKF